MRMRLRIRRTTKLTHGQTTHDYRIATGAQKATATAVACSAWLWLGVMAQERPPMDKAPNVRETPGIPDAGRGGGCDGANDGRAARRTHELFPYLSSSAPPREPQRQKLSHAGPV